MEAEDFSSSRTQQKDSLLNQMSNLNISLQEDLKQENYSLMKQLEHRVKMNQEALGEINSLKNEIGEKEKKYRNINMTLKENFNKEISNLQIKIDELEEILKNQNDLINTLKLELKNNIKETIDTSSSFENNKLEEEFIYFSKVEKNLSSELEVLFENQDKHKKDIILLNEEIQELHQCLQRKDNDLRDLKHKLIDVNEEITLNDIELNTIKSNLNKDHKERGNSLFAEVEDNENFIKKSYINLKFKYKKAKDMLLIKDRENKSLEKQKQQLLDKLSEIVNEVNNFELEENNKILEEKIKEARKRREERFLKFIEEIEMDEACKMYLEAFKEEIEEKEDEFMKKSAEQYLHSISMHNITKEYYNSLYNYIKTSDQLDKLRMIPTTNEKTTLESTTNQDEETNEKVVKKKVPKCVKISDSAKTVEDSENLTHKEKLEKMRLPKN